MFGKQEVWAGSVSGTRAAVSYERDSSSGQYGGSTVTTTHHMNMVLDGRAVHFTGSRPPAVKDGDRVVFGGVVKNGEMKAKVYHNLTTGAAYQPSAVILLIIGIILLVVGVPFLLAMGIGLVAMAAGGLLIFLWVRANQMKALVAARVASERAGGAPQAQAPLPA